MLGRRQDLLEWLHHVDSKEDAEKVMDDYLGLTLETLNSQEVVPEGVETYSWNDFSPQAIDYRRGLKDRCEPIRTSLNVPLENGLVSDETYQKAEAKSCLYPVVHFPENLGGDGVICDVFEDHTQQVVAVMRECSTAVSGRKKRKGKEEKQVRLQFFGTIMPEEYMTELTYRDALQVRNNAGAAFAGWRYQLNALTLTDPSNAAAIPGYASVFTVAYGFYRVIAVKVAVKMSNQEAFALVGMGFMQGASIDQGLNNANTLLYDQQEDSHVCELGPLTGNSVGKFGWGWRKLSTLVSKQARYDDNYAAATGATPTSAIYLNLGTKTSGGAVVLVNGVHTEVIIKLKVLFYARKTLAT